MSDQMYFVFDVESAGLHGEGFAVGYVVIDGYGNEEESGYFRCQLAAYPDWVRENVLPAMDALPGAIEDSPRGVRSAFWSRWVDWQRRGAVMAADVPWPVESHFLNACVADDPRRDGPYPLIDIASVRLAGGLDPLATVARLDNELPAHNPLADARQSARLLLEALAKAKAGNWIESVS